MSIEDLLIKLGWHYKKQNNQFVTDCPYCQKEKHFYINSTHGAWDCKKCQLSGSLYKLRYEFDPDVKTSYRPKIDYIQEPKFLLPKTNYLSEKRKISNSIIEKMKIIFKPMKVGFQYKDIKDKTYLIKWRCTDKKEFYSEPNCKIFYPYGVEKLNQLKDYVIICEGEIDVLSWMTYDFENVVGIPGAGSFKGDWINIFKGFKNIYLSLDNDTSGNKGAEKIIEKMAEFTIIKTITLPENDINDCLVKNIEIKKIIECFDDAKTNFPKEILHVSDILISEDIDFGIKSGFDNFDKMTTLRKGELSIFTGHTKSGKTSFVTNLIYNILKTNHPVLFGSFEMTIEVMKKKFFSLISDVNYVNHRQEDLIFAEKEFKKLPLYFINHYGSIDINKLIDIIKYADKYLDAKYIVLDHLTYMIDNKSQNKVEQIGDVLRVIKKVNLELNNHIFVICHPAKTTSEKEISEFTLRGSAEIAQICDNLFIVRADKENNMSEVELRLARSELAQCSRAVFSVDLATSKYRSSNDFYTN